jgi:hypothetical protein
MASDWLFLTGGRYSEVVIRTGLIEYAYKLIKTNYLLGLCSGIPQTHSPHSFHPELDSQREDYKARGLESE